MALRTMDDRSDAPTMAIDAGASAGRRSTVMADASPGEPLLAHGRSMLSRRKQAPRLAVCRAIEQNDLGLSYGPTASLGAERAVDQLLEVLHAVLTREHEPALRVKA